MRTAMVLFVFIFAGISLVTGMTSQDIADTLLRFDMLRVKDGKYDRLLLLLQLFIDLR